MIYIRSQDKRYLYQVNNVMIDRANNKYLIRVNNRSMEKILNGINIVGTYETEARTIEILDEIQVMIARQDLVAYTKQAITAQLAKGEPGDAHLIKQLKDFLEKNPTVYEMPEL